MNESKKEIFIPASRLQELEYIEKHYEQIVLAGVKQVLYDELENDVKKSCEKNVEIKLAQKKQTKDVV